jgi:hypothetical protein
LKRIKERIMRRTETKPEGGIVETYIEMEAERRVEETEKESGKERDLKRLKEKMVTWKETEQGRKGINREV